MPLCVPLLLVTFHVANIESFISMKIKHLGILYAPLVDRWLKEYSDDYIVIYM